jgi:hypothetical protein
LSPFHPVTPDVSSKEADRKPPLNRDWLTADPADPVAAKKTDRNDLDQQAPAQTQPGERVFSNEEPPSQT